MNKVALITGASTGIGKEFAKIHAEKGGDLVIVARRKDKLQELKDELEKKHSNKVKIIALDLTLTDSPQKIYDELKNDGIQIDYLINNAGFGGHGKFHEREWNDDFNMINLNITSLTAITRLFLPDLVQRNSGKILNVSSTASLMAGPLQAVYFATKAYVTSFSNAIAEELYKSKVTVTNLMPGATATEFSQVAGLDKTDMFEKAYSAHEVALAGYNAMLEGKLDVISGVNTSQKIMFKALPFLSKKFKLKTIRKMQEVK